MSSTNTSTTNSRILKLFKSRNTLIEQLEELQYDVSEHMDFSINEIDAMNNNTQLDFTLKHNKNERKIHVKYYLTSKQINRANLDNIIEDVYHIDNILTKNDTLVLIIEDEPNETTINKIKYLYNRDGIFVVIHNINRLQYNLLNHTLVPKCTILGNSEIDELKKKYNIMDTKQLPEISRFDPQALAKCMRPGQICKFERESSTALFYDYYRICV
ncbi:DNA-directed RNA polymerase subunit RpoH/Rpb5 C-terminal domain-containing protein [Pelagibacteraceae bacterium]|nr:DNA-directed RNA polymerase subunit RpoH/Rpb5 C-terminal domain-containing protein [Pelagibacteraceae bacterium]